jgi:hypothetical protein
MKRAAAFTHQRPRRRMLLAWEGVPCGLPVDLREAQVTPGDLALLGV